MAFGGTGGGAVGEGPLQQPGWTHSRILEGYGGGEEVRAGQVSVSGAAGGQGVARGARGEADRSACHPGRQAGVHVACPSSPNTSQADDRDRLPPTAAATALEALEAPGAKARAAARHRTAAAPRAERAAAAFVGTTWLLRARGIVAAAGGWRSRGTAGLCGYAPESIVRGAELRWRRQGGWAHSTPLAGRGRRGRQTGLTRGRRPWAEAGRKKSLARRGGAQGVGVWAPLGALLCITALGSCDPRQRPCCCTADASACVVQPGTTQKPEGRGVVVPVKGRFLIERYTTCRKAKGWPTHDDSAHRIGGGKGNVDTAQGPP